MSNTDDSSAKEVAAVATSSNMPRDATGVSIPSDANEDTFELVSDPENLHLRPTAEAAADAKVDAEDDAEVDDAQTIAANTEQEQRLPTQQAEVEESKSTSLMSNEQRFKKGDAVQAYCARTQSWAYAKIDDINDDGTYAVRFFDGGRGNRQDDALKSLRSNQGSAVLAYRKDTSDWVNARVICINDDGKYTIVFYDGTCDDDVQEARLKPLRFKKGDAVRARCKRTAKWYNAKIKDITDKGLYVVCSFDGDRDDLLEAELKPLQFKKGDAVLACRKDSSDWSNAKVVCINDDGRYAVRFFDGDRDDLQEDELKPLRFKKGDTVTVFFKDKDKYWNARIEDINDNGTYTVLYGVGDRADNVQWTALSRFRKGDSVLYNRGSSWWYMGKIERINHNDGTYVVRRHNANDTDTVHDTALRALRFKKGGFKKGDRVLACWNRTGRWYDAKIDNINSNGTYAVRYGDGDFQNNVTEDMVRPR